MSRPLNLLFLCTGNSARSILAEAILNHAGAGRFNAFSAGSHPVGQVNPHALAELARRGVPAAGARSKSWDEFTGPGAPPLDVVVTVCAAAAGESCPVWHGAPVTVHWGVEDPAAVRGDAAEQARAFAQAYQILHHRVHRLLQLPPATLAGRELKAALQTIGVSLPEDSHD
jgi:arsenate reductase